MAANVHIQGTVYLLAGPSVTNYRILASFDSEDVDNAAGSEPVVLVPEGVDPNTLLARNDGQPYPIDAGPHLYAGELLMLGIDHNGAEADVDTTGAAGDVYQINVWEYSAITRQTRPRHITSETNRNTTTGVAPATDPKLVPGQIIVTHAWGPVPPNCDWTISGRVRIDLRTAA